MLVPISKEKMVNTEDVSEISVGENFVKVKYKDGSWVVTKSDLYDSSEEIYDRIKSTRIVNVGR